MRIVALLLLIPACSFCAGAGTSGAPLLTQSVGARPLGMGGSYVALTDDVLAGSWNPAGLSRLKEMEVGLSYENDITEVSYGYLNFVIPVIKGHGVGISLANLHTGDIEFVGPNGIERSVPGQRDWLLGASYGVSFLPFVRISNPLISNVGPPKSSPAW